MRAASWPRQVGVGRWVGGRVGGLLVPIGADFSLSARDVMMGNEFSARLGGSDYREALSSRPKCRTGA